MVEWRYVVGNNNYLVSNTGLVMNATTNHILKPCIDRYGYYRVNLYSAYGRQTATMHRLVATAFIPNPLNKPQVNHIDCNRLNNNVNNLEWATAKENIVHSRSLNRYPYNGGQLNPASRLSEADAYIIKYWLYPLSNSMVSRIYGVDDETVRCIRKGITWKHLNYFGSTTIERLGYIPN